jgi:hypothetical protein
MPCRRRLSAGRKLDASLRKDVIADLPPGPPPGNPAPSASKQNPEVLWMALGRLPPAHLAACGCTQINLIWIGSAVPVPKQDRRHIGGSAHVGREQDISQKVMLSWAAMWPAGAVRCSSVGRGRRGWRAQEQ